MTGPEKEALAVLEPFLGEELARDIIAHRRGLKAPLTGRGAKALVREYQQTGNAVSAAEHHLNMGWRGFSAAWMQPRQGRQFHDSNNPMPKPSANYGSPKPANDEPAAANVDPERRRQLAALAHATARGMRG